MIYQIMTISSFIICCIALAVNIFAVGRLIKNIKKLNEEKVIREKYVRFLIERYEKLFDIRIQLEKENCRLKEQIEFFETELATEEVAKTEK